MALAFLVARKSASYQLPAASDAFGEMLKAAVQTTAFQAVQAFFISVTSV